MSLPFIVQATDGRGVLRCPGVTLGTLAQPGPGRAGGHLFRVLNGALCVAPPWRSGSTPTPLFPGTSRHPGQSPLSATYAPPGPGGGAV